MPVGDLYFSLKASSRFIQTDETFEMAEKFDISWRELPQKQLLNLPYIEDTFFKVIFAVCIGPFSQSPLSGERREQYTRS